MTMSTGMRGARPRVRVSVLLVVLAMLLGAVVAGTASAKQSDDGDVRVWLTVLHNNDGESQVVDAGSGGGFDSFIAAGQVGPTGRVVGIDMTEEMLAKSRATAKAMALDHVEFREGLLEAMPVADGWADVVISNGVINLCSDKRGVFSEIMRVLRPGGRLQFADIANGQPVPEAAVRNIDLWTA